MAQTTATTAQNAIAAALAPTGHPHPLLTEQPRQHTDQPTRPNMDRVIAVLPDSIDTALQKVVPGRYAPELAAQIAQDAIAGLASADLVQDAKHAIRTAQHARLTGLPTHPRDVAEQLHQAVVDASAEHLARPEAGGFPLEEARGHEAFSTAHYAMQCALSLSTDRVRTAAALRTMLDLLIREAGA